jgi:hypothetical protein
MPVLLACIISSASVLYGLRTEGKRERGWNRAMHAGFGLLAGRISSPDATVQSAQNVQQAMLPRISTHVRDRLLVVLPYCLMLFNIFYPVVVTTAFRTFWIDCMPGSEDAPTASAPDADMPSAPSSATPNAICYLSVDYSTTACVRPPGGTECVYTPEYASLRSTAWLVIIVYAFMLPVLLLYLLIHERAAIQSGRRTRLSRALAFLHEPYKPQFFYFELLEMVRKQLIIGYVAFVSPGSLLQLLFGFVVALVSHALYLNASPFRHQSDLSFAALANFATVLLLLSCVIIRCSAFVEALTRSHVERQLWAFYDVDPSLGYIGLFATLLGCFFYLTYTAVQSATTSWDGVRLVCHEKTRLLPELPRLTDRTLWHTLISHVWATGHEQES